MLRAVCKGGRIPSCTKELLPLLEDELFRTVSQLGLLCSTDYKQVWDCLQQKFTLKGNEAEWQFQLQNHNHRPSEPLVEFPIELRMLADKAYPTWTAEQHQEVMSNQFIQEVKFQVVREMPATLDQAQELARGLKSVELAQKCTSPVCN